MSKELEVSADRISLAWPSVVLLADIRGFCAGVDRSVDAYNEASSNLPPGVFLYSVGEPAHNDRVNERFRQQGVIFVKHVSEVPPGSKVRFGPHGSTDEDIQIAEANRLEYADTVCPLVTKPLNEIRTYASQGITTIYHGKIEEDGELHPETRAALAAGGENIILVTSRQEALSPGLIARIPDPEKVAFASQTTHNADEEEEIGSGLLVIFPKIILPKKADVCYATRNRQRALIGMIRKGATKVIIMGSRHSSNANNLVRVSTESGVEVFLVDTAESLDPSMFSGSGSPVGITGAASTEEDAIQEAIRFFTDRGSQGPEIVELYDENGNVVSEENIRFKPPVVRAPTN